MQGRHVPGHRGEQEGHHARPGVLEYVPAGVKLVCLDNRIDLVKLMEVKYRDQFLIRDRLEGGSFPPSADLAELDAPD